MIISFAWTTPALLASRKECTRRQWSDAYAAKFNPGQIVQAWSRQPRFGGKHVADIRILSVTKESTADMPDGDWVAEGFESLSRLGIKVGKSTPIEIWSFWKECPQMLWVVRFELVSKIGEVA